VAPTLAYSNTQTGSFTTGTLTSTSFTPQTGDIIVVKVVTENHLSTFSTPTGGGWTYTQRVIDTTANECYCAMWTAPVTTGGTAQTTAISKTDASTAHCSMTVELWRGGQLAATPATCDARGTGSPSATITTAASGSVVSWADGDWGAVGGSPTYGGGATQTGIDQQSPNFYCAYYAWQSAVSAGSQTLSMSAPTGQTWTIIGIEIQASAAAAPPADVPGTQIPPGFLSPMSLARMRQHRWAPDVIQAAVAAPQAGLATGAGAAGLETS